MNGMTRSQKRTLAQLIFGCCAIISVNGTREEFGWEAAGIVAGAYVVLIVVGYVIRRLRARARAEVRLSAPSVVQPESTLVVIGSALVSTTPNDLDVFTLAPEFSEADRQLVEAWAWAKGIPPVHIDVHLGNGRNVVLPAPWGMFPRFEVVRQGPGEVMPVQVNSLSSAIRGEAAKPGAFAEWLSQAELVRIHLGYGYVYPSLNPINRDLKEDTFDGLTAIRNALWKVTDERGRELLQQLPFSKTAAALIARGPRQYEGAAPILELRLGDVPTAQFRGRAFGPGSEDALMEAVMEV
jgi:hypothetical protein